MIVSLKHASRRDAQSAIVTFTEEAIYEVSLFVYCFGGKTQPDFMAAETAA